MPATVRWRARRHTADHRQRTNDFNDMAAAGNLAAESFRPAG